MAKKKKNGIRVRQAAVDDIPALVEMIAEANRSELPAPYDVVDEEFLEKVLEAISGPGNAVVAESRGAVVGVCAFTLMPLYYNPAHTMATSFIRYIAKEHRGKGVGTEMLRSAEKLAAERGANSFVSAVKARDQYVARALLDNGYRLLESYYQKGL